MLIPSQPPWHLWGNRQKLTIREGSGQTQQLIKISYGRPDTWRWMLFARPTRIDDFGPGDSITMRVNFALTAGVGRDAITLNSFETFLWLLTQGPGGAAASKYSCTAIGPTPREDGSPVAGDLNLIEQIPASDIQLQAFISFTQVLGPNPATAEVEVAALFSPSTHIRPDWMLIDKELAEQFPGGEIGGR